MSILDRYSLNRKLMMAAVILWIPSVVQLWQASVQQNRAIDQSRIELQGVNVAHALTDVIGAVADHRGLVDLQINGDRSRGASITAAAERVDAAVAAVETIDQTLDARLHLGAEWSGVRDQWRALRVAAAGLPAQENERRHAALAATVRALFERVVDHSQLLLNSQATGYYLREAVLVEVPRIELDIFELRGAVSGVAGIKKLPHAVRADLAAKSALLSADVDAMKTTIDKLATLLPDTREALLAAVGKHVEAAADFTGTVEEQLLLTDEAINISALAFSFGTKSYQSATELNGVMMPLLQNELTEQLNAAQWTRNLTLFGGGALLLVTLLIARVLRLHINRGASAAVTAIERIADGQIGHQTHVQSRDEFGRVLHAVNRLDEKMMEVVASMRATADTVGHVCRELAVGHDHLGERTQQQAASIEETASSMEEMTATVKQNATNAQQADQLVAAAHQEAERGGTTVQRAVGAMSEINASSKKIADIIGVIDEIAFQTNLLALNAAVEAARAGEQGRGFAVVATEVRNLAQRSAAAAKEIKDLINDSVRKVDDGAVLVNDSGKALAQIMESVRRASVVVAEIAAASSEQSAGIEQVNTVITQLDSATQENAALVEEGSAASKTMQSQAEKLVQQMSYFRVRGEEGSRRAAPAIKAAPARARVRKPAASVAAPAAAPAETPAPLRRASGGEIWKEF